MSDPLGPSVVDGHQRCDACGFDGSTLSPHELVDGLRALGPRWAALLDDAGAEVARRPAPDVWSALEYAAHSRDITALHTFGVALALDEDEPVLDDIDPGMVDAAAPGYAGLDPAVVAGELATQADALADLVADAGPARWRRGLTIGAARDDVRFLVEHALHDSVHHLDDVHHGLAALRGSGR